MNNYKNHNLKPPVFCVLSKFITKFTIKKTKFLIYRLCSEWFLGRGTQKERKNKILADVKLQTAVTATVIRMFSNIC